MTIARRLERLAAVFALSASTCFGALSYEQSQSKQQPAAILDGVACATFGAAGLVELARLRRRPE
jgi:hypothetical protein